MGQHLLGIISHALESFVFQFLVDVGYGAAIGVPKFIEVSPVDEWAHFADGNSGEGAEPFVGGAWQTFFFPVDVQSLAMGHDFLLCVRQRLGEVG